MSSWLSDREQMLVEGAEKNNLDLPIPTQIVLMVSIYHLNNLIFRRKLRREWLN